MSKSLQLWEFIAFPVILYRGNQGVGHNIDHEFKSSAFGLPLMLRISCNKPIIINSALEYTVNR